MCALFCWRMLIENASANLVFLVCDASGTRPTTTLNLCDAMKSHTFALQNLPPFFAEIPYYLWGQVNYDSEGDCKTPTDRKWTWINLTHRDSGDVVNITCEKGMCTIEGDESDLPRLITFLSARCGTKEIGDFKSSLINWDHKAALKRSSLVAQEFQQAVLAPFDNHYFWGSWKWIGWYASSFTWTGRWIMHSVVRSDSRAIALCIEWLKFPEIWPQQQVAICYALQRLSNEPERTAKDWIRWYDGRWFSKGAKATYPEPDYDRWLAEMKAEFGDGS